MMIEQNTNYAYKLKYMDNPTFDKVRDLSTKFYRELPRALQDELFETLNRGVDILNSEPQMTAYLFAFGKMHKAKLNYAFEHLPETFFEIPEINIIDYGCGQAVATMCYADFLWKRGYKQKIRRVTLIEPSEAALKRAALHVSVFFPDAEIVTINKEFDDLETKDIVCDEDVPTLHLLSNVLDLECFSLITFKKMVKKRIGSSNLFVCVGPYFGDKDRSKHMDSFAKYFKGEEIFSEDLDAYELDANNSWTCMVRCFKKGDWEENLSTEVTDEDIENGIEDEFRVVYSEDGKRLLCTKYFYCETYTIKKGVKVICDKAFSEHNSLQSIVIPNNVTSIGDSAFKGCTSLQSIVIPNSVKSIGNCAFYDCESLQSIAIPNSVKSIGNRAFWGCDSLQSIIIPNSVTSIGNEAFSFCKSLQSIVIPNSVKSIGEEAFKGCLKLTSMIVEPYNETYDSRSNCNAIIEKKTNKLVAGCSATIIPNSVTSIENHAFNCCKSLQSIIIPNSVKNIGERAFSLCTSLQSIVISNSVTSIGDWAFEKCVSLQSIVIPNSVTSIGNNAFASCKSLQSIVIPNSVTSIGDSAFEDCHSLQSIFIPNSVKSIGDGAFLGCTSLQSIVVPNSVTSIGYWAFLGCTSLQSIVIPNSVTSIGNGAFKECASLQSIVIINGVTSIGCEAFKHCASLQSIVIPNSVTSIEYHAFNCCDSLRAIIIPKGSRAKFEKMLDDELWDKLVEK